MTFSARSQFFPAPGIIGTVELLSIDVANGTNGCLMLALLVFWCWHDYIACQCLACFRARQISPGLQSTQCASTHCTTAGSESLLMRSVAALASIGQTYEHVYFCSSISPYSQDVQTIVDVLNYAIMHWTRLAVFWNYGVESDYVCAQNPPALPNKLPRNACCSGAHDPITSSVFVVLFQLATSDNHWCHWKAVVCDCALLIRHWIPLIGR